MGRHVKGGASQECPNCGACKESVEHVLFEFASYDTQRLDYLGYLKAVLLPDGFVIVFRNSIFDKTAFCLGEEEGMLVNVECISWYIE